MNPNKAIDIVCRAAEANANGSDRTSEILGAVAVVKGQRRRRKTMCDDSPPQTTVICPRCNTPHGLFWMVAKTGRKSLSYHCNKVPTFKGEDTHFVTRRIAVPKHLQPKRVGDVPEVWAPSLVKARRNDQPTLL